ncbi:unnamed protein product [Cuscuta epithymum]|uniref:F-box associated domain-containing protein n=1 Tax=Cuscuta epithymum TaxID=186058 RepID=A0AAV0E7T5_9ASTE|nr:unnamed protein product [Cuscuta epithymum]
MRVFVLPKGTQGWVLAYSISVKSLLNDTASSGKRSRERIFFSGLVPMNNKRTPVAVIRREEFWGVFLYDFDTKAVQSVSYYGHSIATKWKALIHGSGFLAHYPYLRPSSLSTFAL